MCSRLDRVFKYERKVADSSEEQENVSPSALEEASRQNEIVDVLQRPNRSEIRTDWPNCNAEVSQTSRILPSMLLLASVSSFTTSASDQRYVFKHS